MTKKQLRSVGDRLWYEIGMLLHPYCEACGKPTQQIHHFFAKGSVGHLRYDISNGVGLCMHCHSLLHFKDAKLVESKVIDRRGQEWYNTLLKDARNIQTSYKKVAWYRERIEYLNEFYNNL